MGTTMPPTWLRPRSPAATTSVISSEIPMINPVATGRLSGAMPWISSARRLESRGRRRLARGSASSPPRSSFGARLRTRWPQYGHSVTYGLTSDPQFLQTTKRSGWDTDLQSTRLEVLIPRYVHGLRDGGREDLAHDLAEIVVRLEDDDLAGGAVAAVEELLEALEVVDRAQVLRMRPQAVHQAAGEGSRVHAVHLRQVDE